MRATLLTLGLALSHSAWAAPVTLTHQMRVADAQGAPLEGAADIQVRLWDSATTGTIGVDEVWVSPLMTPTFSQGYTTVLITLDDALIAGDRWMSVSVAGVELENRSPLTGSPASLHGGYLVMSGASHQWSDGRLAKSCLDYRYPNAGYSYVGAVGDGVYRIDPTGGSDADAVDLYCDMTTDGGGWSLIGKSARGGYGGLTVQQYTDLIANPVSHVNVGLLTTTTPPVPGQQAWLDRPVTDALWHSSPHQIVRVDVSGGTTNDGRYYQRKDGDLNGAGLWTGIRDSRVWANSSGSTYVNGAGEDFFLAYGSVYDAVNDTFPNMTDGTFGWWSTGVLNLADGSTLSVSRHMGLLCDGVGNRGGQWMLTSDPTYSGFRTESSTMNAVVWVK